MMAKVAITLVSVVLGLLTTMGWRLYDDLAMAQAKHEDRYGHDGAAADVVGVKKDIEHLKKEQDKQGQQLDSIEHKVQDGNSKILDELRQLEGRSARPR